MRPYKEANISNVDKRILNVEKNLKEIEIYFYIDDEDSCGFRFVGTDGIETLVAVMSPKAEVKVYIGSLVQLDKIKDISHPDENVRQIIKILLSHPSMDERKARALVKISRRVRDHLRLKYIQ